MRCRAALGNGPDDEGLTSTGVTGEIIYVDCGYNILGLTATEEEIAQF